MLTVGDQFPQFNLKGVVSLDKGRDFSDITIERLREQFPQAAKDIKLNLQTVLQTESLTTTQSWGTAVAVAFATRNQILAEAILGDAKLYLDAAVIEDAKATAAIMAMNNVYYRFRHISGKESYNEKPARLRMNWIAKPLGNKLDFELFCLTVSAINGCEMCVRSHEETVIKGGLSEDQVHDAVRLAATLEAAAVALEIAEIS
jgi:alkyl hydroperoxide reductase subunit D